MSVASRIAVIIFSVLVFSGVHATGQTYLKRGEEVVISFKMQNGKRVTIATGADGDYIVCRFGTDKKIEFEYPSPKDTTSWKKMHFNWHMHPSMGGDDGVDYDCLSFVKDKRRYAIYESSSADRDNVGVKVLDLDDHVIANFPAVKSTRKGTLMTLRNDDRLSEGGEY